MSDDPGSTTIVAQAVKRKLRDQVVDFVLKHLWKIVSGLGGIVIGAFGAYLSIWIQISDAKTAAREAKEATTELKQSITNLATRDMVTAQKERIDELADWRLTFSEDVKEARKLGPHSKRRH